MKHVRRSCGDLPRGCWNRDTARYGLRRLVLCTACAAALQGQVYQRPGADKARILRRGAA